MLNLIFSLFDIKTIEQWDEVISSKNHSLAIKNHRATLLAKKTYVFALIFAIIVPAWSIVDYIFLPYELWFKLAVLRFISGFVFAFIYFFCKHEKCSLRKVFIHLSVLLYVPTIFYVFAHFILEDVHLVGLSGALINIYSLLPFLVIAALTIFALTFYELLLLTLPLIIVTLWFLFMQIDIQMGNSVMLIWLFLLLISTSFFSAISQMRYMIAQVTRASYDTLTQAMTRRAGIETLELYVRMAQLQDNHLSLLFIDLDHFKSVNDDYGHDAGDEILKAAVQALKNSIRKGDVVIRWGGEEFLMLLPNADQIDARRVIERVFKNGLGQRPDGKPLTASMGLVELESDMISDWKDLVELADERMYFAKESGRARCIGFKNEIIGKV